MGQLSTDELKAIIGSLVEQKLKEILGGCLAFRDSSCDFVDRPPAG